MVVTYEALSDRDFNRKFKECGVPGLAKPCRGFTVLPTEDAAELIGPHRLCQVYVRASMTVDELQSTLGHESIHVLQYLCGAKTAEAIAYLLETVLHQAVKK